MKNIYAIVFLFLGAFAGAQHNFNAGGRAAALGNAVVTSNNIWSAFHNQAGLADVENPEVAFFYESRFLVQELGYKGGAIALPTSSGTFGLSVGSFGYSNFSYNKYGLGFGKKLGENFSTGIQINYHNIRFGDIYGSTGYFTVELGSRAELSNDLVIAVHIFNPSQTVLDDTRVEQIPSIFRLGLNYRFSDKVLTLAELEKNGPNRANIKAGVEYQIHETLYLRASINTQPVLTSFGFGVLLNQFKVNFSSSVHSVLGYTPQLSLSYEFN